jgi:hypothetical protein
LFPGQGTRNRFNRINAENRNVVLIVGMKMRVVMWRISLPIHANDDSKETAQFRHEAILLGDIASWQKDHHRGNRTRFGGSGRSEF